ncbi:transposase [Microcoleus sp. FACHB-DQ6]|nr:transposase [Microcoleus sp. FACHB-DQ6]
MVRLFLYLLRSFYALNCGSCAAVVMENLPAPQLTSIKSMIEKVGAMVIYLSPYYPDFNPIEMWCSQLNFFCECSLPRPQR